MKESRDPCWYVCEIHEYKKVHKKSNLLGYIQLFVYIIKS